MKQKNSQKGMKLVGAWLPEKFVDRFHSYVRKKNEKSEVSTIFIKTELYHAINEYMQNHSE